jgi:hypothetical protein
MLDTLKEYGMAPVIHHAANYIALSWRPTRHAVGRLAGNQPGAIRFKAFTCRSTMPIGVRDLRAAAHRLVAQQLSVASGPRRTRPGRDRDSPGADRVIDQYIHVDEQILGRQHGRRPLRTRNFGNLSFSAEATSRSRRCWDINLHNAPKALR